MPTVGPYNSHYLNSVEKALLSSVEMIRPTALYLLNGRRKTLNLEFLHGDGQDLDIQLCTLVLSELVQHSYDPSNGDSY